MILRDWKSEEHLEAAVAAAAERPFTQYRYFSGAVGTENLHALAMDRARRVLQRRDTIVGAAWQDDQLVGLAAVVPLPWDSQALGFNAARLELVVASDSGGAAGLRLDAVIGSIIGKCAEKGIVSIAARVGGDELPAIHALQRAGFELLDGIQTFSLQMTERPRSAPPGFELRLSIPADEDQLAEIARTSYRLDRFHADAMLPAASADKIYEEWVRNSCRGIAADAVIVAADSGALMGYVICRIDREAGEFLGTSFGAITLVATAEACRGRGVAIGATLKSLEWFWDQGVRIVEVGTQIRNINAARVYENAGFRLTEVSLTFRKDLSRTS